MASWSAKARAMMVRESGVTAAVLTVRGRTGAWGRGGRRLNVGVPLVLGRVVWE